MARPKSQRGHDIRNFALRGASAHPTDLVRVTAEQFGISRQAAGRHIAELVERGELEAVGTRRQRTYALKVLQELHVALPLAGLEEHIAWRDNIMSALSDLPGNVLDMWNYGCTEMINNAIDHAAGKELLIMLKRNALKTTVGIIDDGVGIFRKIKEACGLDEERHAVLELAKGKLTTDPASHTGEGIFFTSRIMDEFMILSGDVVFSHKFGKQEDWIFERDKPDQGTAVFMELESDSTRTTQQVVEQFASEENDYGFTKTVVPVRMAREGSEKLVSRSQAKRLMSRLERFNTVLLDFEQVDTIGRAFADEIFRVFVQAHPNVIVLPINANAEVLKIVAATQDQRE